MIMSLFTVNYSNKKIQNIDILCGGVTYQLMKHYQERKRKSFDLPLKVEGTEFQKKVWKALCSIPYGETRSYKEIAIQIGNERACRAVGMANNKNPIGILIPCHRVIGTNHKLVGYAGGLDKKEFLLKLEKENKQHIVILNENVESYMGLWYNHYR